MTQPEELPDFDRLWNYADPASTEEKFQAILPRAQEPGNCSYYLQLLTQIARTHGLRGNFTRAHEILDEVEEKLTDEYNVARIRYLLERGRAFNSSGQPEKAMPLFLDAWERACKRDEDYYAIDAAHMMGIIETSEVQLEWHEKGVRLAEKSTDNRARGWLGALYNNIGLTNLDLAQWDDARAAFEKCEAFHVAHTNPRGARVARWCVAHTIRRAGDAEKALKRQRALLLEYEDEGVEEQGFCAEEIGECLYALGQTEEAKPFFKTAYEKLQDVGWVKDDTKRLNRLKELAG